MRSSDINLSVRLTWGVLLIDEIAYLAADQRKGKAARPGARSP